jgi:hypothetical protein
MNAWFKCLKMNYRKYHISPNKKTYISKVKIDVEITREALQIMPSG